MDIVNLRSALGAFCAAAIFPFGLVEGRLGNEPGGPFSECSARSPSSPAPISIEVVMSRRVLAAADRDSIRFLAREGYGGSTKFKPMILRRFSLTAPFSSASVSSPA